MHDDIYDHDHPDNFIIKEDEIVTDIEGLEMFSLKSVGIDIGSSTSHLIFSHITLRREGASLSGKFRVTGREVLYRSPIMLTPYISATKIDTDKVNGLDAGRCRHRRGDHHRRGAQERKCPTDR
jgi:ethanolamine utilization protein EutA